MASFNSPKPVNWVFWKKMPQVDVWQAIALSMGFDPGNEYREFNLPDSQEEEFDQRFQITEAHIRRGTLSVLAWPHKTQNGRMEYAVVDLVTFGTFARDIGFAVPAEMPLDPVNWEKWGRMDSAQVWQAVLLAIGHSPDVDIDTLADVLLSEDCLAMIEVARSCYGISLSVRHAMDTESILPIPREDRAVVSLPKFREWAESKGYTLPSRFPQAKKADPERAPVSTGSGKPADETGSVSRAEASPVPSSTGAVRIFISHSSADVQVASSLIGLLRSALNLRPSEIRCTSVDGYRLEGGANTEETLRREVRDSELFIGLISEHSLASFYVLFELGARWLTGRPLIPLLASGTSPKALPGPLSNSNALSLESEGQLHQLVDEIAQKLSIPAESPAVYASQLSAFKEAATGKPNVTIFDVI